MIKLSIIVPVYNVAPYLRKCVDSLLSQDFEDYEIILVDDGSPDGCPQICDEYAKGHANIWVIHQTNAGLSAARNAGLKVAKGEYVSFVDSDDYWEENVLGGLMEQVERENLDVLRYDFRNVNDKYEEFHPNKDPKRDVDLSEEVVDGETFLNERLGPGCYACQFILRRDLIYINQQSAISNQNSENNTSNIIHSTSEKSCCLFTEGIYFEDTDWTPRMLLRANRVASTPKVVYNYLWRTGSITLPTDPMKRKKVLEDKVSLLRGFLEQQKLTQNPIWFKWMTSSTAVSVLLMIASLPIAERQSYIAVLKALNIFPLYTKKEKMLTHRLKIYLANISPYLFCSIMNLISGKT